MLTAQETVGGDASGHWARLTRDPRAKVQKIVGSMVSYDMGVVPSTARLTRDPRVNGANDRGGDAPRHWTRLT